MDSTCRPASIPARPLRLADLSGQSRYFWGYDGTLIVGIVPDELGPVQFYTPEIFTVPWKHASFAQPIPAPFRRYGHNPPNRLYRRVVTAAAMRAGPLSLLRAAASRLFGQRPR